MARGRKKTVCRDIRRETIRACEAMKLLNLEGKTGERFFYRLCEEGYIQRTHEGGYLIGEVLFGYFWACAEKRLGLTEFLLGLSDFEVEAPADDENATQYLKEKFLAVGKMNLLYGSMRNDSK